MIRDALNSISDLIPLPGYEQMGVDKPVWHSMFG